jgi:hypothetical protein
MLLLGKKVARIKIIGRDTASANEVVKASPKVVTIKNRD